MKPFVIGTREDVIGFALAGVDGVICLTREEVDSAIEQLDPRQVVMFTASTAALASSRIAEWEKSGRGPAFVVLPPR